MACWLLLELFVLKYYFSYLHQFNIYYLERIQNPWGDKFHIFMATNDTGKLTSNRRKRNSVWHALALLIHPEQLRESSLKFSLTFGLGGMALLLFVIQAITGMLLRFVYEPTPSGAYDSIIFIRQAVFFGGWMRNIHYWGGMFLVIITVLHLLRVFYTQAYYPPRRINWIAGLFLLALVVMFNFTGYLLPWDQLAYWAVTVVTNMLVYVPVTGEWLAAAIRGGEEVGGATLLVFYNLHTGVLPVVVVLLMVYHFWKVRRAGGVVVPADGKNTFVPAIPRLLEREVAAGLALMAFVLLLSLFADAPLLERADPSFSPNPVKAPWYFAGVQELLLHFHPVVAVFLIPFLVVGWLFVFPYLRPANRTPGRWFYTRQGRHVVVVSALVSMVTTVAGILLGEYLIDFQAWFPGLPEIISNGFIPLLVWGIIIFIITFVVLKRMHAGLPELNLWIFTYILVAYTILMLTGTFLRGEGMLLTFSF